VTVGARTLWLSAFGAAGAWSVHVLAVVAMGSARCLGARGPVERYSGTWWVLLAISAVALACAIWAARVSKRSLERAGPGPSGRRERFMAYGGVFLNAVFLIGIGFGILALFLVPVCL